MATSGDLQLAISGDFSMATDTPGPASVVPGRPEVPGVAAPRGSGSRPCSARSQANPAENLINAVVRRSRCTDQARWSRSCDDTI